MKVLLSNPPWWLGQQPNGQYVAGVRAGSRWPFSMPVRSAPDRLVKAEYVPAPLFLMYAASYCRQALPDVEVAFRDSIALRESYQAWVEWTAARDPDFVVLESATPSWEHDAGLLRYLAQFPLFSQVKVIVTGPIATAKGAEILAQHANVVACIKGEYEKGVVRVLRGERGVIDHDLLTTEEMNQNPPPWIDPLHAHLYFDANPVPIWPQLQAWTSRGCPFKCVFCVFPGTMTGNDPDGNGKRTARFYDRRNMYQSLQSAIRKYDYKSVYFDDDTMNLSDKHTLSVCFVMKHIGLPWGAMCRADTIRPETWRAMREAGCQGVKIGVESGSQYVLDNIVNKRLDLGVVVDRLRLLKSLGMRVHTTFTVGLPGETKAQEQETFDFIRRLYDEGLTTTHQLSGTAAIEGTPLHQIGTGAVLAKYPGATADGFDRTSDGMAKLNRMAGRP